MATILHIDTSGPAGIAMLSRDGKAIAFRRSDGEREHAGNINGMISGLLQEQALSLSEIDAFAVCNGPGSYTGLRIGLATAKGFCFVLNKPLLLHNRLQLMLREAAQLFPGSVSTLALLPARSGEYYAAATGAIPMEPTHITIHSLINILGASENSLTIIGRAAEDLSSIMSSGLTKFVEHSLLNNDVWAAEAERSFTSGNFADIAYADPEYLKPAFITAKRPENRIQ